MSKTVMAPDRAFNKNGLAGIYFDKPTMVRFRECEGIRAEEDNRYLGGIAYCNEIICGECGGIIPVDDCEFIEQLSWVSISEEILAS